MMAILNKVLLPNLNQLYQRQGSAGVNRCGNSQPSFLVVIFEWREVASKIGTAILAAANLINCYRLYAGIMAALYHHMLNVNQAV